MSLLIFISCFIFIATRVSTETLDPRIEPTVDDDNWIQDIIKEILWTETTCPAVPVNLSASERAMLNNLINAAFLGKNMYFSSVTQIQSPNQTPSGNGDGLSIMKRNLGENNVRNRYHPLASEFGDNQRQFIQVAHILANGQVCFANEKLPRNLPNNMVYAKRFVDVINTYIMFLNHKNQNRNIAFRYL